MKNGFEKVGTDNAEHYVWENNCNGWHLVQQKELSIIQERVPPGCSEVNHFHKKTRQFFCILEGKAIIEFDTGEIILNRNEGIEILPGTPHKLYNKANIDLIFLVISQPESYGDRIIVEE